MEFFAYLEASARQPNADLRRPPEASAKEASAEAASTEDASTKGTNAKEASAEAQAQQPTLTESVWDDDVLATSWWV